MFWPTQGFTLIEVPPSSPEPFKSIAIMAKQLGSHGRVAPGQCCMPLSELRASGGGRMIVSPNVNADVIKARAQRDWPLAG